MQLTLLTALCSVAIMYNFYRTMIITMVAMGVMQSAINQVIDMISMRHRFMSTPRTMTMPGLMTCVSWVATIRICLTYFDFVFVNVVIMGMVEMTIMKIIDVISMFNSCMTKLYHTISPSQIRLLTFTQLKSITLILSPKERPASFGLNSNFSHCFNVISLLEKRTHVTGSPPGWIIVALILYIIIYRYIKMIRNYFISLSICICNKYQHYPIKIGIN